MSPINVTLRDLITQLNDEHAGADDLAKISEAQRRSHTLSDLGEQLVSHYVAAAKDGGASWSQIGEAIGVSKQAAQQRWVPAPFERYTNRARHVIVLAEERSRGLEHNYIGPEHLLLGLLGETEGLAGQIIVEVAGSAEAVQRALADRMPPAIGNVPSKIPFSRPGKQVLEQTTRKSLELGHNFVGTEHLLLGLLAVTDSAAAEVLVGLGITEDVVKPKVRAKLAGYLAQAAETARKFVAPEE